MSTTRPPTWLQARAEPMEDLGVEDDKQEGVGPALPRVTYALHGDEEGVVKGGTAGMLSERAPDGD